jgi:hypothetical protein
MVNNVLKVKWIFILGFTVAPIPKYQFTFAFVLRQIEIKSQIFSFSLDWTNLNSALELDWLAISMTNT